MSKFYSYGIGWVACLCFAIGAVAAASNTDKRGKANAKKTPSARNAKGARVTRSRAKTTSHTKVALGRRWFQKFGCEVCHTTDGKACFGSTLMGLYGTMAKLEGGKVVRRNAAYFRAKIAFSAKMPLANGMNVMPIYKDSISPQRLDAIVALIKSLRRKKATTKNPTTTATRETTPPAARPAVPPRTRPTPTRAR